MIRVFIGVDYREMVSAHVLAHSIIARASQPVAITFITPSIMPAEFTRKRDSMASNEFSDLRFMVPYLCEYDGWAIFMDCDMMVRDDIAKLWHEKNSRYTVQCVQRSHTPNELTKYLGTAQNPYPRKNWSSVMLFNNNACRALTPDYINGATGLELHRFNWEPDDAKIGAIPHQWNHLVSVDAYDPQAKNVHWTVGGPWFYEYTDADYATEWYQERMAMTHANQIMYPNAGRFRRMQPEE